MEQHYITTEKLLNCLKEFTRPATRALLVTVLLNMKRRNNHDFCRVKRQEIEDFVDVSNIKLFNKIVTETTMSVPLFVENKEKSIFITLINKIDKSDEYITFYANNEIQPYMADFLNILEAKVLEENDEGFVVFEE